MPLPTMTTSAVRGTCSVVRWPNSFSDGSLCQYDSVGLSTGRPDWPGNRSVCVMLRGFVGAKLLVVNLITLDGCELIVVVVSHFGKWGSR